MTSAFQIGAFQDSGYQIENRGFIQGGGKIAKNWERRWKIEDAERERLEKRKLDTDTKIAAQEVEIAQIEADRAQDLADQELQLRYLAAMGQLASMQKESEDLKARILMFMRDEDDVMTILYALPFM